MKKLNHNKKNYLSVNSEKVNKKIQSLIETKTIYLRIRYGQQKLVFYRIQGPCPVRNARNVLRLPFTVHCMRKLQ